MTFDTKGFKAILDNIAAETYRLFDGNKNFRNDDTKVLLSWRPHSFEPFYMYSIHLLGGQDSSAHRKIAEAKYKTDCKDAVKAILEFIRRDIPALDTAGLSMSLEVRDPTKSGQPRLKIDICGHRLSAGPVTLATIVKKVATLANNLQALEKPGDRKFLIGERSYFAKDGYDALRIHSALVMPEIFEKAPDVYPQVTISEVLPSAALFEAIFHA